MRLRERLALVYGADSADNLTDHLLTLSAEFRPRIAPRPLRATYLDQRDAVLITSGDMLRREGEAPLATLELPSDQVIFFNFLASHDGIGVTPARGILPPEALEAMAQHVAALGDHVSFKNNSDGTQSAYELNINYLDALGAPGMVDSAETPAALCSPTPNYQLSITPLRRPLAQSRSRPRLTSCISALSPRGWQARMAFRWKPPSCGCGICWAK